jgi:hypothetical protein
MVRKVLFIELGGVLLKPPPLSCAEVLLLKKEDSFC